jgi:hypothetical protein
MPLRPPASLEEARAAFRNLDQRLTGLEATQIASVALDSLIARPDGIVAGDPRGQLAVTDKHGAWVNLESGADGYALVADSSVLRGAKWAGITLANLFGVTISEPLADNDVLAYDTAADSWINQTAAEAGLAATVHTHDHTTDLTEVGTNTHAQLDSLAKLLQGTFLESFDALVVEDGGAVKVTLEQADGGDLTMVFSDGHTVLDCTPILSIPLTEGVDFSNPQRNYVYILQSAKILAVSLTGWPDPEHIKIGLFFIQTATEVAARGALVNQNWNDHAADTAGADVGQGHLTHITERTRRLGAVWLNGCEGVATQDGNDLWVSIASGEVSQLHPHTFAALDSDTAGAGDDILVVNDPDAKYVVISSLNEITKLSDGSAIGNNKYIKIVCWAVANKSGTLSPIMANVPSGQYNTAADAIIDVEGYANFTMPPEFKLESTTGFLVVAFVCKHTATAMQIDTTIDQRGNTSSTATGAGTGGGDVTAAAVLADNAICVGDGGAKGIQDRTASIADNGVMLVPGIGDGGLTNYDLKVGNVADYGMIQFGNALIGRTSYNVGAIDLDGAILIRNISGPVSGEIEVIITESSGNDCRFAIPRSAVGNATYNPRSMLLAGPAPADTDFVKVSYWQTQGIFHNLACDTAASGSDLGVQNDLEVEGDIYTDSIKESTSGAGITLGNDVYVGGDLQVGFNSVRGVTHLQMSGGSEIQDFYGNPNIKFFGFTQNAVNYFYITNAFAGVSPSLVAAGGDANIDLVLGSKGTGKVKSGDDFDVTGDITLTGTVDGRDIAADGIVLDTAILDGDITGNGLMIRTAAGSYTNRLIAVADAKLTVSNADGTAGNPTLGFGSVALADLSDGGTIVTADANLTDDALLRGKGGALGAQTSPASLTDAGVMAGITQLTAGAIVLGTTIKGLPAVGFVKFGDAIDCNGKTIFDGTRDYIVVADGLSVSDKLGVGLNPVPFAAIATNPSGPSIYFGVFGGVTYTGTNASAYGLLFPAVHSQANPSTNQSVWGVETSATNAGVAAATKNMKSYGTRLQAINTGAQDQATANAYAYGLYIDDSRAGSGANTAGNFYGYGLFIEDTTAPAGTPTSNEEWCALFEGPVQINDDQPFILGGSATVKGDTHLVYDSAGTTLDFFLSGTEEMNIGVGVVNIVNELNLGGDLNHDGSNIGFFASAPVAQAAAYTQTYATADRTLGAYTADDESGAYTGIDNAQGGTPYAQLTDLNALRVAYENLRALNEDTAQMLNALVDDMQAYALVQ